MAIGASRPANNYAPDSITAAAIAAGAVGSSELATNAVGADELATGAVGADELADDAVGASEIAAGAVGTSELADGAVTTAKIEDNSVTAAKLSGVIVDGEVPDGGVSTSKIADEAVTAAKLAPGALAPQVVQVFDTVPLDLLGGDRGAVSGRVLGGYRKNVPDELRHGYLRNRMRYTEDLSAAYYSVASASKGTETIEVDGITLTRLTAANFYGSIRSQLAGLGHAAFTAGQRYLMSYYAVSKYDEQFVWMGNLVNSTDYGHGSRLIGNRPRRLWRLVHALETGRIDTGTDPTVALGSGASGDPYWLFQGDTENDVLDVYVGGFQIEQIDDSSYVDGIAMIGDSTMAGSAAEIDFVTSREVSRYLESLLNVSVFNRAVGGNRTGDMDTRWATDITPLAHRCKYAIIQGGINDIANSVALATIQTNIASMVTKAQADGMVPVLLTCTPTTSLAADPAKEADRLALNEWLKTTYPNVIDIAEVVEDPHDTSSLQREAGWYGDGIHYGQNAKRAIAARIAAWGGWDFIAPGDYQKVDTTTRATAAKAGFFGATPIVKPAVTGSRGGNAALASLLTQLASLGLVTDSSSA